ncbi:MAG: hypothetical protein ACK5ZH_03315, partial [Alphaproteobacteria bacterium]
MTGKKGTEVKNGRTDLGGGAYSDYKNSFEVTTGKEVLIGNESTLHYSTKGTPDRHEIDLMVDGLKKNDGFRITLNTDTRDIIAVDYIGKDRAGLYKGTIKTFQDPALASKIEEVWKAAVKLQPGETTPVITGEEAKALAGLIHEVKDVANKIP